MDTSSTTVCKFSNPTSLGSLGMLDKRLEKCSFVRLLHMGYFLAWEHFEHLCEPSSGTSTCCQRAYGHFLLLLLRLFRATDYAGIRSLESFSKCPCGACRNSWGPLQLVQEFLATLKLLVSCDAAFKNLPFRSSWGALAALV